MSHDHLTIAWLLVVAACGGERGPRSDAGIAEVCAPILPLDSPGRDPGPSAVDCHALDGYEIESLEDFEPGTATAWQIDNDRTALQSPRPDQDPVTSEPISGGRCLDSAGAGSHYALHLVSGTLTRYGGIVFRNLPRRGLETRPCPVTPCLDRPPLAASSGPCGTGISPSGQPPAPSVCLGGSDKSAWEGVVLWGKKATASSSMIRVHLGDLHTDPSDQACECTPFAGQFDTRDVCDEFGLARNLDSIFRAYLLPFADMRQSGFGRPSPAGLDTTELFSISIDYGLGSWDFWIDDIGFYRKKR